MIARNGETLITTERTGFYLITIIIAVLIGSSYFLPMMDLPQHAGQVELLRAMLTGETEKPWFDILELNLFTPYWIAYLPASLLSLFLPVNYSINITVAVSFLLFVLSFSILRKHFNSPAILDWILLPAYFGFCYALGFITFLMAIPLGVLLLIQQLEFLENKSSRQVSRIVLTGILLYFSHLLAFLFFCQIAIIITLVDNRHPFRERLKKLYPFCLLGPLLILFFITSDFFSSDGLGKYFPSSYDYDQGVFAFRIINLFIYPFDITNENDNFILPPDLATLILLAIPFLMEYRLTRDPKRYVPLISFLIVWFLLPSTIAKTSFIYHRFSVFLIPFYILIFDNNPIKFSGLKKISIKVGAMAWMMISAILLKLPLDDLFLFNQETKDFLSLMEQLPEEKTALSLMYDIDSESGRQHPAYAYFPLWYQALKKGWVEFNFAWFPPQPLRYRADSIPENRPGFAWNPEFLSSFKNCDKYELLFVRIKSESDKDSHKKHMRKSACNHTLKYHSGLWSIYTLD